MERNKKPARDADGLPHSRPGSVTQQSEDSFPASDAPTFSPGAVGAPVDRRTPSVGVEKAVQKGERKVEKAKRDKKPIA